MARKLYRFMTPLGILALGFGMWLWLGFDLPLQGWLHAKLGIVVAAGRLPLVLRPAARRVRRGAQPALAPLVPLVQRGAGAAAAGRRDPGRRQAVLGLPASATSASYFAICPRGLETGLADELRALGAAGIQVEAGGVGFAGDMPWGMPPTCTRGWRAASCGASAKRRSPTRTRSTPPRRACPGKITSRRTRRCAST